MFPTSFGFDFSAALPWLLFGFVSGLVFAWIFGRLWGQPRQTTGPDVHELHRAEVNAFRSQNERLTSDLTHMQSALAEAEARAAQSIELKQRVLSLSNAELASRNEALSAQSMLEKARGESQSHAHRVRQLDDDHRRAQNDVASLRQDNDAKNAALAELKSELHRAGLQMQSMQLAPGLQDELEIARNELAALQQDCDSQRQAAESALRLSEDMSAELDETRLQVSSLQDQLNSSGETVRATSDQHAKAARELEYTRSELMALREKFEAAGAADGTVADANETTVAELANARSTVRSLEQQLAEAKAEIANLLSYAGEGNGEDQAASAARSAVRQQRTLHVSSGAAKSPRVVNSNAGTSGRKFRVRSSDISLRSGLSELAALKAKVEELSEKTEELREMTQKGE